MAQSLGDSQGGSGGRNAPDQGGFGGRNAPRFEFDQRSDPVQQIYYVLKNWRQVRLTSYLRSGVPDPVMLRQLLEERPNVSDILAMLAHRAPQASQEGRFALHTFWSDSLAALRSQFPLFDVSPFRDAASKILSLAKSAPEVLPPLVQGGQSVLHSARTVAQILAGAMFSKYGTRMSFLSSDSQVSRAKFKCLMHYLSAVDLEENRFISVQMHKSPDKGQVQNFNMPQCTEQAESMFEVAKKHPDFTVVDFANRHLGGGAFGQGAVQEEILFMQRPECYLGMLYDLVMTDTEAIVIRGAKQFSNTSGYDINVDFHSAQADGPQNDILAIDALYFRGDPKEQFSKENILRELEKCMTGFEATNKHIISGAWGCGVFNGNRELKYLIQVTAARFAGVETFVYCELKQNEISQRQKVYDQIKHFVPTISVNPAETRAQILDKLASVLFSFARGAFRPP